MPTKEKFEELCDIRQPITMKYNNTKILKITIFKMNMEHLI